MLRYLIILLLPLTLFSQIEEKRLALVIGNSNYDKGPLNNPVNDALLMAKTLDSLDFDVILDTNIAKRGEFLNTIREFGNKRSDYDVAFVYYAGHGIQVGAENFLLPTKEVFETEFDVMDNGVSVQNIMRYLTGMTNQVNVLILDACRDNPFEGNWNKTRSLKGGGLAKIPPPTGSLIAFSTDAGNTAADGDGKNSVYCQSLSENLKLVDVSLDQMFRNIRSDVLKQTNGNQRPVEASQLTGQTYYITQRAFSDKIIKVNDLYEDFKYVEALKYFEIYFNKKQYNKKLIELYLKLLIKTNKIITGLNYIKSLPKNLKNDISIKHQKAKLLLENNDLELAETLINEILENSSFNSSYLTTQSRIFYAIKKENKNELINYNINLINAANFEDTSSNNLYNLLYNYYLLDDVTNFVKNLEVYLTQYNWTSHQIKTLIKISNEFYISTQLLKEHNLEINDYTKYNNLIINYAEINFPNNFYFPLKKWEIDAPLKIEDIEKSLNLYPFNEEALDAKALYYYNKALDCKKDKGQENCDEFALKSHSIYSDLIDRYPENKVDYIKMIAWNYYFNLEDFQKVALNFEKIMDDIIWWKDWRLYADALWELKDYDKAIEIYYDVINKINKQKVYYSDSDFRYNTSDIYARLYYLFKEQNNFKEAYEVIKKGYEINPERRQLDVIESAIFNEDYEYAIELSKKEYLKINSVQFLLLQAISHFKNGEVQLADSIFQSNIKSPADVYEKNKDYRIARLFNYCNHYYLLKKDYENVVSLNEHWIDWYIEESYEDYYANYYYIAYAKFEDEDYINALINIEKAIMLFNSNMYELDEENYIALSEKKIKDLKESIIIKLSKN